MQKEEDKKNELLLHTFMILIARDKHESDALDEQLQYVILDASYIRE